MPWDKKGGGGGPWGGGSNGGGGGGRPPDLEDLIRKGQDRFKGLLPSGGLGGGKGLTFILLAAFVVWMLTGLYRVQPDE